MCAYGEVCAMPDKSLLLVQAGLPMQAQGGDKHSRQQQQDALRAKRRDAAAQAASRQHRGAAPWGDKPTATGQLGA